MRRLLGHFQGPVIGSFLLGLITSVIVLPELAVLRAAIEPLSPPVIGQHPVSVRTFPGRSTAFSVAASSPTPMNYQWFWNGTVVADQTNATLLILNARAADAGAYFVQVSNTGGAVRSNVAILCLEATEDFTPGNGDATFNPGTGADGELFALQVQSDGKLVIGGAMTTFDGRSRPGLARLNSDGTLDPSFSPDAGVDGTVRTLLLQPDGKILGGGVFSHSNGLIRSNLFRLNSDGSIDESFQIGNGTDGPVYSLAIDSNGKILVAGAFSSFDSKPLGRLVRLNPDGSIDSTFASTPPDGFIYSAAVQTDERIIIGGTFSTVGNSRRIDVARLLPDGRLDWDFNPGWGVHGFDTAQYVRSVLPAADGKLYISGNVKRANDEVRAGVVRLTETGEVDPTFFTVAGRPEGGLFSDVHCVAADRNGRLLLSGQSLYVNGLSRPILARINTDGSVNSTFGNSTNAGTSDAGYGNAIAILPDDKIVAVGNFTVAGGLPRNRIARFFGGAGAAEPPNMTSVTACNLPTLQSNFLKWIGKLAIRSGEDVILGCGLRSSEPVEFQWKIGNESIPGATNPTLRLPNLRTFGAEPVTVTVRNVLGTDVGTPVYISVTNVTQKAGFPDPRFAPPGPVQGLVSCVLPEADGQVLISGSFMRIGDTNTRLVARLGPNGQLGTFDVGWVRATGSVHVLQPQEDSVYLGGDFAGTRRRQHQRPFDTVQNGRSRGFDFFPALWRRHLDPYRGDPSQW